MNVKKIIKRIIAIKKQKEIIAVPYVVPETLLLKDKVAFIAGGSGGIGFSIARSLLRSGCKVIIAGTRYEKMLKLISSVDDCEKNSIKCIEINLNDLTTIEETVSKACAIFGKIDIFINSAGTHTPDVDFWEMSTAEYDRILNLNLKSVYFMCQVFGKYMRDNKIKGHILLISSSRGSEPAWSPYGISKWGVDGLVKGLAQKMTSYGIIVNGIAPGPTATDLLGVKDGDSLYSTQTIVGRLAEPNEISEYAKLMVSDLGNMVVGEILHISGGRGCFDIR